MSEGIQKRVGRVFCVTGYTHPSCSDIDPASSTAIGQCETDSNSSGYLSSSSFESSSEERRLGLNEQKVFQVWEKWSQQRDQPRNSTPKNAECTFKARLSLSTEIGKGTLALKKNLGAKPEEQQPEREKDSFWDIVTPQLFKSRSENDMRDKIRSVDIKRDLFSKDTMHQLPKHDAGSIPNLSTRRSNTSKPSDWKRRPFHTLSTSDQDLRLSKTSASSRSAESVQTGYQSLPRYRVIVDDSKQKDNKASTSELANKLTKTCADFMDNGVPVDESMTEFLANVDQDNLASFLNFYDKVTNSTAYEKARRNPKNYEAVYY